VIPEYFRKKEKRGRFLLSIKKRLRERIIAPSRIKHLAGPEEVPLDKDDVIVLCLCRDEENMLDEFISHYRNMGVRHFVFLDNGSADRTRDVISSYPDCTLLFTDLPYATYKVELKRYLIRRFSRDRWSITADADEFFDYPYSDSIPLPELIRYLDRHGYTAVHAPMLDMFSPFPVDEWEKRQGGRFQRSLYRCFELSHITNKRMSEHFHWTNRLSNPEMRHRTNGVRRRVFGYHTTLTKFPLTKCVRGKVLKRTDHQVRGAMVADFSCVLYHYKLAGDFVNKTEKYAREGNYWKNSLNFRKTLERMENSESISLVSEDTMELTSLEDLIVHGFLEISGQYLSELGPDRRGS
jgi:hypothetical protein